MKEIFVSILFLAIAGGLLWGWNRFDTERKVASDSRPSITALSSAPVAYSKGGQSESSTTPAAESKDDKSTQASQSTGNNTLEKDNAKNSAVIANADRAKIKVKIMNGGAAKGTAGKVQQLIASQGYSDSDAVSAKGDYVGTTVYYTGTNQSYAEDIKSMILASYPSVAVKQATSTSTEDGSAPVVIMMGK